MNYSKTEQYAYNKGYFIDENGICFNNKGKILGVGNKPVKNGNYLSFRIRNEEGDPIKIKYHRLQAYQKYGEKIYLDGTVVRHLNGDSTDNSYGNIAIGTNSDNMFDQTKEVRIKKACNANKKHSDKIVEEIRILNENGVSYKKIQKMFNITSKGTVSYIINKRLTLE